MQSLPIMTTLKQLFASHTQKCFTNIFFVLEVHLKQVIINNPISTLNDNKNLFVLEFRLLVRTNIHLTHFLC